MRPNHSDSDEDDFARVGDDPLSLEELDGWMNSINTKGNDSLGVIIPPEEESKEQIPDA